ncbi:bifunctional phosphopantothenoylcysteine decarboxylase/phosphopantothenate--cysteine ligase CoaBC [Sinanaerobacter chloroacetimidivorans]|jgi:phosphopantothenoylcysteine decarboxylase|uniref:Bifunctional phosphopantothenoylcysteine decarboxylase/phosphopantothenate--cysteine ligase CoaBC n=1 Tax=Sinanaerobacter chloroacetimidivorans TaxID=2818044 RepID=A0A8J7VZH5_9FIRM|nr:bifunctional phosphopantothenoylcysteine decarboxylase/phosphopantothenate--cysteine ligase CoaBC [Sinanaerobacter chloroacetimidivorans]MBR0596848.1 bifunctional phosphopantothenoylcysteine decarboxylase/phosphopantothenate--cysteine ligase CoaBC [Sinanaerobacter chloroacetimidivorans]
MKNVLLCVTGSIAAYKAADIANRLTKDGYHVEAVMTESAQELITPLTFRTLTKNRVYSNMFQEYEPDKVEHISLAKKTDLCLIAPATANIIGKIANGIADDMVTTVVMALKDVPVYICPAMNTNMYENPIVQRNIKTLSELGYYFIEPKSSYLACGDLGKGALADVELIVETVEQHLKK